MSVYIIKRIKNFNTINQLQIFNQDYIQQGFIKKNKKEFIINIYDKIFKFPIDKKDLVFHITDNLLKTRFESWFWKDSNLYYGSVVTINYENNYELINSYNTNNDKVKLVFLKNNIKINDKFKLFDTFKDSLIVKSNKNLNLVNLDTEDLFMVIRKITTDEFQISFTNEIHKLDPLIIIAPLLFY